MNDKKHIDRLFQEGFKDFEVTPNDSVWENIESQLKGEKKKRRVIPIWWRYAGVAALLLLLITVGYLNISKDSTIIQVVENDEVPLEIINNKNNESKKPNNETKTVIADNTNSKGDSEKVNNKSIQNKINTSKESATTLVSNSKNESKVNTSLKTNANTKNKNTSSKTDIANLSEEKIIDKALKNNINYNTSVAESNNTENKNDESIINKEKAGELLKNTLKNNKAIVNIKTTKTETKATLEKESKTLTIEEVLEKNKEVVADEKTSQNKWRIAPNAAPVYFNTLGEGSSIDPQFNKNAKSGDLNMSYGISASYAINNKLSIRSGINKVNLGYNTNDVVVFQSLGPAPTSALQNIDSNNISNNGASVIGSGNLNNSEIPGSFITSNTSINQALGYIEIPLEIQYTLTDKKLGVNFIGGFSSFFLNNNEIFSETENGIRTFVGEANNINKLSYSANFGLGFNYKMTKKIDLNLEPMFKYQINTFKNTSGNFKPFFIGVYTGFAIKF
ncbi:MAG: outer membrane beta-barrel protein [Flaviramulus sp.]|nr:outer membrane beta-barrel protein [Flaviramulus sp.]